MLLAMLTTLLLTLALGCPSCRHHGANTQLPDPAADDRPDGSPAELPRVRVEMPPNGEGKATLAVSSTEAGDTAQPLEASFTASVFEPGGRPVREGLKLKVRNEPSLQFSTAWAWP